MTAPQPSRRQSPAAPPKPTQPNKTMPKTSSVWSTEAIEEEGKDCLTLLTACGAALKTSSPKGHDIMVTPYQLLLENAPMSTLLSIPLGVSPP